MNTSANPDLLSGYSVICDEHGEVPLTVQQYNRQLNQITHPWKCIICGEVSHLIVSEKLEDNSEDTELDGINDRDYND